MTPLTRDEAQRCGFQISERRVCFAWKMRGFEHCRHHLTPKESAVVELRRRVVENDW